MIKEKTSLDDLYKKQRHRLLKQLSAYRLALEIKLYYEYYWDTNNSLDDIIKLSSKPEEFDSKETEDIVKAAKELIYLDDLIVEKENPLRIKNTNDSKEN